MKTPSVALLLSSFALFSSLAAKPEKEAPAIPASTPASEQATELFRSGKDNKYGSIRIPALLVAKNHRLLAFAEGRKVVGDQGMNDLIVRHSDDDGKTWTEIRSIADSGKDTFNNPCPVYDAATGEIFVLFQRYPHGTTERNNKARPGLEAGDNVISNHVISSKDNGLTWSKPLDITATTKGKDITLFAGGPNAGVQITHGKYQGRLAIPYNQSVGFGKWTMYVVYSDDHGKTWKMGDAAKAPLGWVNETTLAETDKGGLYLNSRKWGGRGFRKVAWSNNGGEHWTEVKEDEALYCDSTQGTSLKYSFPEDRTVGGKSRLLFAGPSGPGRRQNGKVLLSYDDGKSWEQSKVVIPGNFAYASMARLRDGRIGLLYEPGGDHQLMFTTFTIDWLTDGKDKSK